MDSNGFQTYDNIDREVVKISKDKLLLHLKGCAENALVPSEARSYAGLALTLLASALLTDHFYDFWGVPGETIRAAFIIGGIISAILAGSRGWKWHQAKDKYTPEEIIKELTITPEHKTTPLLSSPSAAIEYVPKRKKKDTLTIPEK